MLRLFNYYIIICIYLYYLLKRFLFIFIRFILRVPAPTTRTADSCLTDGDRVDRPFCALSPTGWVSHPQCDRFSWMNAPERAAQTERRVRAFWSCYRPLRAI